jgi:Zn-finger nucleic acid-binding protein
MAYRDEREQCPRCKLDLIDASVARACSKCNGLWISAGSVHEMVASMQVPPEPVQLHLESQARTPLACPTCKEGMDTRVLYGVEIDLCTRHGIWFDGRELATVLLRAARKPG